TIIRVRRKRGAEPAEALVLSLKKARTDDGEDAPQRVLFSLWRDGAAAAAAAAAAASAPEGGEGEEMEKAEKRRLIDWELSEPRAAEGAGATVGEEGEGSVLVEGKENAELSFVSDDAIGEIGEVQKMERRRDDDVIMCNGAPLQPAATAAAAAECDDVFDFYRVAHPNAELVFEDEEEKEWEIAVATRQEMLAYIGAMEGVDGESEPDSEDSNDENNWRNDYPDESSDEEDAEDDDVGRRRRRALQFGDEEYGSSDEDGFRYGGEDTEDDGEDELAEDWRNFRIG
ncbi:hypothetical protein PENTCL1PPCAC_24973, partial [Pristionchus entomophagus]